MQSNEMKSVNMVNQRNIIIKMGKHEILVPNDSLCPKGIPCFSMLYVCEFCLHRTNSPSMLRNHEVKCTQRYPPGVEIYCKDNLSIFEVDGLKSSAYCKNLCLLSKIFTEQKISVLKVKSLLFYVMVAEDSEGCHIIGFFSKSKDPFVVCNLFNLLVLPPYQKKGFGRMLIDFSYLLTKRAEKISSPDRPLSDLGRIAYLSYWKGKVVEYIDAHKRSGINIKEMSQVTAMTTYDIVEALQQLDLLRYRDRRYIGSKGICILRDYLKKAKERPPETAIDPSCLRWRSSPPVPYSKRKDCWRKGLITLHFRN